MGWSEWPAWVRGGVIGALVSLSMIVIYLGLFILGLMLGGIFFRLFNPVLSFLEILTYFPFFDIPMRNCSWSLSCNTFYAIIILMPEFFIIGALIGFIVGKIKSRGEVQYKNV